MGEIRRCSARRGAGGAGCAAEIASEAAVARTRVVRRVRAARPRRAQHRQQLVIGAQAHKPARAAGRVAGAHVCEEGAGRRRERDAAGQGFRGCAAHRGDRYSPPARRVSGTSGGRAPPVRRRDNDTGAPVVPPAARGRAARARRSTGRPGRGRQHTPTRPLRRRRARDTGGCTPCVTLPVSSTDCCCRPRLRASRSTSEASAPPPPRGDGRRGRCCRRRRRRRGASFRQLRFTRGGALPAHMLHASPSRRRRVAALSAAAPRRAAPRGDALAGADAG